MVVIKINIPRICEPNGTVKYARSRGEKRWRWARCRFSLVCSITIYKADIFPNKSFFSNLVHRTTDKLDVDGSWRGSGTSIFSEADAVFCCAVAWIFIRPLIYLWTIVRRVQHRADSCNDLHTSLTSITSPLYGSIIKDIRNTHLLTMKFHYSELMDNEMSAWLLLLFSIKHLNFLKNKRSKQFSKTLEMLSHINCMYVLLSDINVTFRYNIKILSVTFRYDIRILLLI